MFCNLIADTGSLTGCCVTPASTSMTILSRWRPLAGTVAVFSDRWVVGRMVQCNIMSYCQIGAGDLADVNHLNGRGKSNRTSVNYETLLRNVPAHILEKILHIYHLDFIMFGYDKSDLENILQTKKVNNDINASLHHTSY